MGGLKEASTLLRAQRERFCMQPALKTDVQMALAKQAEPSLFLFNPAIHAGASDVTPRRTC